MISSRLACLLVLGLPLLGCGSGDGTMPVIDVVMPMDGALHVEWSGATGCDTIEGERKDPMNAYAVAFTVPGTETSHMDAAATANMMYTYRLHCKVGGTYSPYSNEKSANPTQM